MSDLSTRRIDSKDNPNFKAMMKSIAQPRLLRKSGVAVAEGIHLFRELLAWPSVQIREVWFSVALRDHREWPELESALSGLEVPLYELDPSLFERLSELEQGAGPLTVFDLPHQGQSACNADRLPSQDIVVLDGIQDPGNVGTIIRTAAAAGVGEVWFSASCAWPFGSKVLRAGMGGHAHLRVVPVPVDGPEWVRHWREQGLPVRATLLGDSASLYESDLLAPGVWLLGSEGGGLSQDWAALATQNLQIPMINPVESLNVSAAAAICLFEQVRCRLATRSGRGSA